LAHGLGTLEAEEAQGRFALDALTLRHGLEITLVDVMEVCFYTCLQSYKNFSFVLGGIFRLEKGFFVLFFILFSFFKKMPMSKQFQNFNHFNEMVWISDIF